MKPNIQQVIFIIDFLNDLRFNNNREWFNTHKDRYLKAKKFFDEIVNFLIKEIAIFDTTFVPTTPKDYVFRIYRDIRFSKNKDPYKAHFGAFMAKNGRKSGNAGYYFHLEPENTMAAGGIYGPDAKILKSVRTEILFHNQEFKKLLLNADFQKRFGGLSDMKLLRPPRGFPKDHPDIELAKYKSYIFTQPFDDKQVESDLFIDNIVNSFRAMKDMNMFINNAIQLINEE